MRLNGVVGVEQEEKESGLRVGRTLQLLKNLGIQGMAAVRAAITTSSLEGSDSIRFKSSQSVCGLSLRWSAGSRVTYEYSFEYSFTKVPRDHRMGWHHSGSMGGAEGHAALWTWDVRGRFLSADHGGRANGLHLLAHGRRGFRNSVRTSWYVSLVSHGPVCQSSAALPSCSDPGLLSLQ